MGEISYLNRDTSALKELPVLNDRAPVAGDYASEYYQFVGFDYDRHGDDIVDWFLEDAQKYIDKGSVMLPYTTRFPVDEYKNVVNSDNKHLVHALDQAANKINQVYKEKIEPILIESQARALTPEERGVIKDFLVSLFRSQAYFNSIAQTAIIPSEFPFDEKK